jgi:hypothetical protein
MTGATRSYFSRLLVLSDRLDFYATRIRPSHAHLEKEIDSLLEVTFTRRLGGNSGNVHGGLSKTLFEEVEPDCGAE